MHMASSASSASPGGDRRCGPRASSGSSDAACRPGDHPVRVMTASVLTRIVEGDQVAAQEVGSRMAAYYEIRIKGRIGDSLLLAFEGLTVSTEPVETILHGPLPDQEALHELLSKIQSLGLEVVELRRLPAVGPQSDAHTPPSS